MSSQQLKIPVLLPIADTPPDLPVGGEFKQTGFVAPVQSAFLYMVSCYDEIKTPAPDMVRVANSGWRWHYWYDAAVAEEARKAISDRFPPQRIWRLECSVGDIVNVPTPTETLGAFGTDIGGDVDITTMGQKARVPFHFIVLPAAVAAVAKLYGWDCPEFDIQPLTRRFKDDQAADAAYYSDAFYAQMVGSPDQKDDEAPDHWTRGYFWTQRAAVWRALGEDNPLAYLREAPPDQLNPDGTIKSRYAPYVATGSKLIECLRIVNTWNQPIWGRLFLLQDPRPDGVSKAGSRLSFPCFTELFADESSARAAAQDELDARGDSGGTTTASITPGTTDPSWPTTYPAIYVRTDPNDPGSTPFVGAELAGYQESWRDAVVNVFIPRFGDVARKPKPLLAPAIRQLVTNADELAFMEREGIQANETDLVAEWIAALR